MSLRRFWTSNSGVAAVEMALLTPVIAGLALASFSIWESGLRRQNAHNALDVASQYYMNGGSDDTVAQTLAASAWTSRPQTSSLSVRRDCRCVVTPLACNTSCSDGSPPATYVSIVSDSNDPAAMVGKQITLTRVIRVR